MPRFVYPSVLSPLFHAILVICILSFCFAFLLLTVNQISSLAPCIGLQKLYNLSHIQYLKLSITIWLLICACGVFSVSNSIFWREENKIKTQLMLNNSINVFHFMKKFGISDEVSFLKILIKKNLFYLTYIVIIKYFQ